MAGESLNPTAVDKVLDITPTVDEVRISATEAVRLRERAAVADRLERRLGDSAAAVAVSEATSAITFANETASLHARQLLAARVIVKPGPDGEPSAYDRITGRPAAEVLRELVSGDEFAMYRAAQHRGGPGLAERIGLRSEPPGGLMPKDPQEARRRAIGDTLFKAGGGTLSGRTFGNPLGDRHNK